MKHPQFDRKCHVLYRSAGGNIAFFERWNVKMEGKNMAEKISLSGVPETMPQTTYAREKENIVLKAGE